MKSRLSSLFYMLAPCVVLAGFALYLSRVSPTKSQTLLTNGPFQLSVSGVEKQPTQPIDVYEGYDRHYLLIFGDQGRRPKWWGTFSGGREGKDMKGWTFWLEKDHKRHAFVPNKAQLWTSGYDKDKKRYTNEFLLHCGDVSQDWALKARGNAILADGSKPLVPALPFEVTLKKAGEKWQRPQLSTDTGSTVQNTKIVKENAHSRIARITLSSPHFNPTQGSWGYADEFLDGNWRKLSYGSYYTGSGKTRRKAFLNGLMRGFGGPTGIPMGSPHTRVYEFYWNPIEMSTDPRRDIIGVAHITTNNHWPLEIAFYTKRGGQQPLGEVHALTRPAAQTKTAPSG